MNVKLFATHLLKVILLMIGTRVLIATIPLLLATTIPQENPLYLITYYSSWVGNFVCAIVLAYLIGKFNSTAFFTVLLAIFSPGLTGLFSMFLKLEQIRNEK